MAGWVMEVVVVVVAVVVVVKEEVVVVEEVGKHTVVGDIEVDVAGHCVWCRERTDLMDGLEELWASKR